MINSGATYNCNEGLDPYYKTDENLVELFASLDCGYDDVFHNAYEDLFFTNICLGYRNLSNVEEYCQNVRSGSICFYCNTSIENGHNSGIINP